MADITLTVKRTGDTDDSGSYWQSFTVPEIAETMSVLDALIWTQQNIGPHFGIPPGLPGEDVRHLRRENQWP